MFKKGRKFKVIGIYIHIDTTNNNKVTKLRGKEGVVLKETNDRILGAIEGKEYSIPKRIVEFI